MSHSKKSVSFPPVLPSTSEGKEATELKTTHHKEIVTSEMDDTSKALVCSDQTPLQCDFIPEEIILSLTNTAYAASCPEALLPRKKAKNGKEMKLGMRPTSNVWHHPCRREKFRYLTDHPISFTGAGRDVSFLYDVKAEKLADSWLPHLVTEITSAEEPPHMGLSIPDSSPKKLTDTVIPEEFHIASNTGVEGLQYYDDKYTTLLTDSQNRLLLFPSMKPNKRIEVIQLKKVMDMMLEKAGVDADKSVNATQMHKILEVLKTEQNIYNTVFHEIIRQISVECSDRGELLANIRQRYVNLLDKIAQQMIDFYKDMVAQRIMDKRIIEELYNFKKVVEELSRELVLVREYDLKLRRKAEAIHEELMLALHNAEKNARIVEQYHDLYTSQRIRMETDIKQLTSERDLWNTASYDLALKVINKNNLTLARRLYLNEKAWNKYVTHFIVMLASQDAKDLSQLQKATHQWRSIFRNLKYEVEQNEDYIRGRVNFMENLLTKLQTVLEKNKVDGELAPIKDSVLKTICADFRKCNQVNELHIAMIKWMVNLLILMVPDHSDEHSLPKTQQELSEEEIHLHTGVAMLEIEGISLAKMLSRFSIYIFSCCKSTVAAMSTKKTSVTHPDPTKEVTNLSKIKKECIDWVTTCNILLSKLKGRKVTLLSNEDTKNLYDYELVVDSKTYDVSGWEKTFGEMAQQYLDENFKLEETPKRISYLRPARESEPQRGSNWWEKSTFEMAQKKAEAFPKRSLQREREHTVAPKESVIWYAGKDQNIHSRPLTLENLTPTEEELTALEKFTNNEKERYEALQLIESLKFKLLDTEARVQHAEEKFEEISEKLTEALAKNRQLQKELEKANESLKVILAKETPKDEAEGKDEAKDKDKDKDKDKEKEKEKTKTEDNIEEEEEDKKPGPSEKKVSIRESPSKDKDHHPPSKSITKPFSRSKR
uniref:Axonemal dynein light chain domain containing 1 n=1 Tax=Sarcophilus harrisii TaxID=9305 RepID=A0A7N4PB97_SARHA